MAVTQLDRPKRAIKDTGAAALLDTIKALSTNDEQIAKDQLARASVISEAFKEMLEAQPFNLPLRAAARQWLEFFASQWGDE